MPTYGYQCRECGHRFEVFQKMTDAALTACENCGGALKKLLYPVGIQFKGSGFYINDYARSSQPKEGGESKTDGGDKTETPAKTDTTVKTDTAAKTDATPAATTT